MKIMRTPVFHRIAFKTLVDDALYGQACLRYRGRWWAPLISGRGFSVYHEAPDALHRMREQLDAYEFSFYAAMLRGRCGADGELRPRTRLFRGADGVYRASYGANGEAP